MYLFLCGVFLLCVHVNYCLLSCTHHSLASDICNYLSSRHGIIVNVETVKHHILVELTGELELEPAYKMDLVEMTALLLIPYLLKSDDRALQHVLKVMLEETDSAKLSREFLKTLLDFHGETQVANSVLDDMVNAAGGEGTVLNETSLRKALTADVTKYGVDWDQNLTTHYEDVFKEPPTTELVERRQSAIKYGSSDEEDPSNDKSNALPFKTVWTAPSIDFTADTYRSQTFSVVLWVCMVIVYLAYFWSFDFSIWGQVDCSHMSNYVCTIVNGITRWLVIFLELR